IHLMTAVSGSVEVSDQLSTMNSMLSSTQQRTICSQLGRVKLQLLYKASIHGFTGAAFHERCDTRSPTVSVGYNNSGYVFGGYTKQPFTKSGNYVHDDQAFLFTFSGEKLLKYPVTGPAYAVYMDPNSGPYFGGALVLVNGNQAVVYSSPGNYYNFNAAEMHGNNLNLTECEVYQVEETTELERKELIESIKTYKPIVNSVPQVRVLLIGPVGAGKSSFFNSINSVFRGHVTSQAIAGSSTTSLTTQFRTYSMKAGREGKPLPIILCDTMGLEESTGAGLDIDDIISILKGHLPDRYQVQLLVTSSRILNDKVHCVAYVIDACKISNHVDKAGGEAGRYPQKDQLNGSVKMIKGHLYLESLFATSMQEVSARLGVPLSCVIPVKNYSEELELDLNCDILLLSAVIQMLRFADNYFDEIRNSPMLALRY
uniref:TLDc domain-containing protein n=1 Tax=Lates calcarifer TaxID=8187 RepID=A0A4W6CL91_LATCA